MRRLRFGPYTVETSNEDKMLFPDSGLTKGDLIDYYRRIADTMLPHLADRTLSLQRFPDGLGSGGFYQKQAGDYFPDWIERVKVKKEGGQNTQVVIANAATLVYLANQAMITPHVWLSRSDRLRYPDRLVFDLDPPTDDFAPVRDAAEAMLSLLDDLGLPTFVQTTGSRGVHLVVPLDRSEDFDTVREFAKQAADRVADESSDRFTTAIRKEKRSGKLFIDVNRNAYGQTFVAPYAVRAREGAPVATPLRRDELGRANLHARSYTIENIFHRLGNIEDPWKGIKRRAVSLRKARTKLGKTK